VLDSAEHLLANGMVELLGELRTQAPAVKCVVTSREVLDLQAEWVFEIQGLPVPRIQLNIEAADAVGLFLQRARRADVGFTPATTDHSAVVLICQLVAGMPLAIELAASWVRTLCCADIVAELEHHLGFLSTSARDVPARHRSMQAAFDHCWKLLSEEEQCALRQLSVFRGSFSREAAVRVAGASLGLLSSLASKSLVRRAMAGRYDLHELLWQCAEARLAAEPEACAAAHTPLCLLPGAGGGGRAAPEGLRVSGVARSAGAGTRQPAGPVGMVPHERG
jgi:predicted ATPase